MSDLYLSNFTLSQSISLHSSAVRCISACDEYLLTGSYDRTLILSRYANNLYEPAGTFAHHSSLIYSCLLLPNKPSFVSCDQQGMIFLCNYEGTHHQLASEPASVSSLRYFDEKLLSGCWNGTAKLWDLNTNQELALLDSKKHSNAVCVEFTPFGILTGSANGYLNFWDKAGKFINSVKVHDNVIKNIHYNEELGILTASNDSLVKRISPDGRILHTFTGHSAFVFTCNNIGLDVISAGDDKTVRIWKDNSCAETIFHPNTVWELCTNYVGDIITACGDNVTRVFTLDKERVASEEELEKFAKASIVSDQQSSDEIDLSKYPGIEKLSFTKGKKEGDIQIFRNQSIGEVYMWHVDGEYWEKIGEAIGSAGGQQGAGAGGKRNYPGDRFFPAGEYDYVFDVELGNNVILKLPFNNTENPLESAEKFLAREGLGRAYLQEITKFINDNAKPVNSVKAPKPEQSKSRHFPLVDSISFDSGNLDAISKKLKELNTNTAPELKMDEVELRCLDRIIQTLGSKHPGAGFTVKEFELVLHKLLKWPKEHLFPCFDLYRFILLNQSAQEVFKTSDHGAEHIAFISGTIKHCSDNASIITGLRVLCNMFHGNSSSFSIETRCSAVLDDALSHIDNKNKLVRLGLITLLLNFSVRVARKNDFTVKTQILSALSAVLADETDNDNIYRALVTVGNLIITQNLQREVLEFAKELDFASLISNLRCTDKALEVKNELLIIFS